MRAASLCLVLLFPCGLLAGEPVAVILSRGTWEQTRLVVAGEWVPYGCGAGVPYRGGSALRFERQEGHEGVSIDGGPFQPAWISLSARGGPEALRQALEQGARGFNILTSRTTLPDLAPIPAGRDIALTASLTDFAPLLPHKGASALAIYAAELTDLSPLAAFTDLTSLRLNGWRALTDLRPLARLPRLVWLRLLGCPDLEDLSPLADVPSLAGLKLQVCRKVTDLSPLARCPNLTVLRLSGIEGISDLSPLAKAPKLRVLEITACKNVTDLAPLRPLLTRGTTIIVPKSLQPQLDELGGPTRF